MMHNDPTENAVPAAFFAQWTSLQVQFAEQCNVNGQLKEDVLRLKGEKLEWKEENNKLSVENSKLRDEKKNWIADKSALEKRIQELEEEKDERKDENSALEKEIQELRVQFDNSSKVLLDKFYDCSVGQFDLIALFNYYKAYGVSADEMKETLTADHRETLTIPGNLNSLVGEANVREFFETIAALPNLKSITGYFTSIHHCYLQHKEGIVPRKVLGAFCAGRPRTTYKLNADICDKLQLAELSVSDYFTTVIPLLPEVTDVWVSKTKITTLDWCAALPERIRRVDIDYCPNIQDCTPLLKMKGLKQVWFNSKTNSSFNAVKEQLRGKGVTCKMPG